MRKIYSLSTSARLLRGPRLEIVAPLRGRTVRLVREPVRGSGRTEELVGELVSVAHSSIGTGTFFAVVRVEDVAGRRHDEAVSLATVVSIEELLLECATCGFAPAEHPIELDGLRCGRFER